VVLMSTCLQPETSFTARSADMQTRSCMRTRAL
jgi:hypothetical protein